MAVSKKYEHEVVDITHARLEQRCDEMSAEGWELVTCVYAGGYGRSYTLVFRREIAEKSPC